MKQMLFWIPWFLYVPVNVGNLISGSSAFAKLNLNIWNFYVYIMLNSSLEELSITLLAWEMSTTVQWLEHFLVLCFLGTGMRMDLFLSSGPCWLFQIFWRIEWSTLLASSFRILSSFAGILSPPLALWAAVLLKTHVTSHSRRSGSEWENTPLWLSGSLSCCCCCCLFVCLYSSSVYFFHPFLVYSAVLNHKTPKSQSDLGKEEQCSRLGLLI